MHKPKRLKLEDHCAEIVIKAILAEKHIEEIIFEMVYTGSVEKKQNISRIMQELSKLLPLQGMQHLKRVHLNNIIICRAKDIGTKSLKAHLQHMKMSTEIIDELCVKTQIVKVPANQPKLRWQYEAMQQYWPTKFHPDKHLESLYDGTNFTSEQTNFHTKIAKLALRLSHALEAKKPVGICIDPRANSIIAIAASKSDINPLMHAPMLLIDFVARTQDAGAWNDKIEDTFMVDAITNVKTVTGILKRYHDFIQSESVFVELQFGAERLRTDKIVDKPSIEHDDNLAKYGPYLCTGYDVYLSHEPCLMCAMALIHSRVKRIFFVKPSSNNGALVSCFKLHAVKELNHHYEVFQCIENNSKIHNISNGS